MQKFKISNVMKWLTLMLVITLCTNVINGVESINLAEIIQKINIRDAITNAIPRIFEVSAKTSPNGLEEVTVAYVVDGDTIVVYSGSNIKRIRMIGVNTPESVHADDSKNTDEGTIASIYTKEALKQGTVVYLEYDVETEDQYGRTLAYVWLSGNCDLTSYEDFCKYNYGAILLQNTYCDAVYYEPNGKYKEWYEQLDN